MPPVDVEIDGRHLTLSNLDKVLYPDAAFTKADVVDYCRRIAPVLLPHLGGRPPTLVRAPDGPGGVTFYEKNCPSHRPDWVRVARGNEATGATRGCLVDDVATLVWLANLAALELHTHQWALPDWRHPTAVVVDLDPGAPATIIDCCRVALELRDVLARLHLDAVVKTSGSKGLHVSVPLGRGGDATDEETKRFALALGQLLERRDPQRVTVDMAKRHRAGRVFVDWSQNDRHKTTVAVYSLRLRPRPFVSTPLAWEEVERAHASGTPESLAFDARSVLDRVDAHGDLYAGNLTLHQELPSL
jgi:bifunctional non-homologous end joining protein LigD